MAYTCILGRKRECDGCGKCQESVIAHCDWCNSEISSGDVYYLLDNETICEDCIADCRCIAE